MKTEVLDYFDFERASILLEYFNKSTGFVTAILDLDGNILCKSGWRQICTDFHRKNPETALNCFVSDTKLANKYEMDEKYHFYQCVNGLIDVKSPIVINGKHIANLFSGQLFLEEPDILFFENQAKQYGFDQQLYIEALKKVPVISKAKIEVVMDFLVYIMETLIEMTVEKMQQIALNEAIKKSETALLESEQKYKMLFTSMSQGLALHEIITDTDGKPVDYMFLDINDSYNNMLGITKEMAIGKKITDVMPKVEQYWIDIFGKVALTGEPAYYENYLETTGRYYATYSYSPKIRQFAVLVTDITERKKAEEDLIHLNTHDSMTDLYNRRFFEEEMKRLDTESMLPLSVIMGDINGVKFVNDAFGHEEGDRLIVKAAEILQSCCLKNEILSRIGGDEFTILMPKTDSKTAYKKLLAIQSACDAYNLTLSNSSFSVSIALGCCTKEHPKQSLAKVLRNSEEYMYKRKLLEHRSSRSATIAYIRATLQEKNRETEEYCEKLILLSRNLGKALELSQKEMDELELLATLHDIGNMGISEQILTKPGKLTNDEWDEMKKHPQTGYRIAMAVLELIPIAECILCHQERWDGKGYPCNLSGECIPQLSRIISIVDAYNSMTHDRPYRKRMTEDETIREIIANAGTQFDPNIARVFVEKVLGK